MVVLFASCIAARVTDHSNKKLLIMRIVRRFLKTY